MMNTTVLETLKFDVQYSQQKIQVWRNFIYITVILELGLHTPAGRAAIASCILEGNFLQELRLSEFEWRFFECKCSCHQTPFPESLEYRKMNYSPNQMIMSLLSDMTSISIHDVDSSLCDHVKKHTCTLQLIPSIRTTDILHIFRTALLRIQKGTTKLLLKHSHNFTTYLM